MAAATSVLSKLLGTEAEKKNYVDQQFRRALDATNLKRQRLYSNLAYYFGDQIPNTALVKASKEQRDLMVYNIAQRKVTGLVGALLRNSFNINYMSVDGTSNSLIYSLQDMLAADQNAGSWDNVFMLMLKYGCIEEGVIELTTSTAESPLGNLRFEITQPGSVIVDPNWRTSCSADMEECFKYTYLSPNRIIDLWPEFEDQVKESLINKVRNGREYDERGMDFNSDYQTMLGTDYMVLQYSYMQSKRATKTIDLRTGTEFPETTDTEYKKQWMAVNGIDPEYVRDIEYKKRMCNVMTTVPGLLEIVVQDKPHQIQIERIPYFPWSPERINGEVRGIVDIIKGLNDTLNKRENMLNNIIESSANGASFVDPDIVDNDPEQKKAIQDNWSNPKFKAWTAQGKLANGKNFILPIPKQNPPSEIFAQINHLWEAIDRVLPVNASADGRAESASESGILYSMKQQAIEVAQTTIVRSIMNVITEIGDAYFRAAKSYYSDVERTFVKDDGSTFSINEVVSLPTGDLGIRNDISSLQNLRTMVKMGQDSPNARFSRRLTALDMLKLIPPTMPTLQVEILSEIMDTLDVTDQFSEKMTVALEQARAIALSQEEATYATNKTKTAQAMASMQPQQSVPGQAMPGQPMPQVPQGQAPVSQQIPVPQQAQPVQAVPGPEIPQPPAQPNVSAAVRALAPLIAAG